MAKMSATERAQQVIDGAVQLFGARGRRQRRAGRAAVPRDPRAAHLRRRHRGAAARSSARAILRSARQASMHEDHCACRHVRARQPAAAGRSGRSCASTCRSCVIPRSSTAAAVLLDDARASRARRARRRSARPAAALDIRRAARARESHRARARRRPRRRARATACCCVRPNTPMLAACWFAVMKAGAIAVAHDAAAAREGADRTIVDEGGDLARPVRRRLAAELRGGARGVPDVAHRACIQRRRRRRPRGARARASRRRSTMSTPPPTTPRSSPSRRAPRASPRARCTSTATCSRSATACRRTCCAPTRRRRLHRHPAARVHVRAGRPAAVPAARRRVARCCSRRRRPMRCSTAIAEHRRDRAVHGADVVSRDAPLARARHARRCASACRPARRCRPRRARCGRRRPASRSSTASARPRCCTSSSRTTRRARPGATGKPVPGYTRASSTTTASRCRRGERRPARGEGPDRLPLSRRRAPASSTCRTAGTSPATPISSTRTATYVYQARTDDMIISRRLQHRRARSRERAARSIRRSPSAPWSACRTRSAGRW